MVYVTRLSILCRRMSCLTVSFLETSINDANIEPSMGNLLVTSFQVINDAKAFSPYSVAELGGNFYLCFSFDRLINVYSKETYTHNETKTHVIMFTY